MFRTLLTHHQEALNKRRLVYYMRVILAAPGLQYNRSAFPLQSRYICNLFTWLRPRITTACFEHGMATEVLNPWPTSVAYM
jgi:hypothetical protein